MDQRKLTQEMLQVLGAHKVQLLEYRNSLTDQLSDLGLRRSELDDVVHLQKLREDVDKKLASENALILSYIQTEYGEWQRLKHLIGLPDGHEDFEFIDEDPVNRPSWVEQVAAIENGLALWKEVYFWRSGRYVGPPGEKEVSMDSQGRMISAQIFGPDCVECHAMYVEYADDLDLPDDNSAVDNMGR